MTPPASLPSLLGNYIEIDDDPEKMTRKSIMAEKVKATPLHKANLATQLSAKKAKRAASAGERLRGKQKRAAGARAPPKESISV